MNNGKLRCLTCKDNPVLYDIAVLIHLMGGHKVTVENNEVSVAVHNIKDDNRQRKDYGDIAGLAASIKQYGLIQPIVLSKSVSNSEGSARTDPSYTLVAGGRRLAALRFLHITDLVHARDFIWREELNDDSGKLQLQAVELEENLRRKELHWAEHVLAKQRLFETMQNIHGTSKGFGAGKSREYDGFSLRRLAAMLGENPGTTSRDLEIAGFLKRQPLLAEMPTKADAVRKLGVAITVAAMQNTAKKSTIAVPSGPIAGERVVVGASKLGIANPRVDVLAPALSDERWLLYEGPFQKSIDAVADSSVDLVLTDLPYNIGLGNSTASHAAGLGQFSDDNIDIGALCHDTAVAAYRVLRDNRFGVFFYGMAYHQTLFTSLVDAGFSVDVYPFIWLRDRSAPPDGFARYSKTYDPALIASKGNPRFIRPNLSNALSIPSVRGPERLHAAQKPVAIMQKFIEDMTTPGCVVLDMFAGAGTTGVAALQCKRKAILFEMEKNNCTIIRSRLGVIK